MSSFGQRAASVSVRTHCSLLPRRELTFPLIARCGAPRLRLSPPESRIAHALAALESLASADDPEIRATVSQAIARDDPSRAAQVASRVLSDRVAFNRLAIRESVNLTETLQKASAQLHYQGVAVPHLVARRDVVGLTAVANNRALPEETRLGAVEGLAAMTSEPAEKQLEQIGRAAENSEELRKAAWRGLRRSRRTRQQTEVAP